MASGRERLITEQQIRLADAFLAGQTEADAAKAAGYSTTGKGKEALGLEHVRHYIEEVRHTRALATGITRDDVIGELWKIARANLLDFVDDNGYLDLAHLPRSLGAALGEVTMDLYTEGKGDAAETIKRIKFKMHSKQAALETIAKIMGWMQNPAGGSSNNDPDKIIIEGGLPPE